MGTKEMTKIATIIELTLLASTDTKIQKKLRAEVTALAKKFPAPQKSRK